MKVVEENVDPKQVNAEINKEDLTEKSTCIAHDTANYSETSTQVATETPTPAAVDDRPLKCAFCPKAFKLETMLRYHETLHKEEKFFECDFCGRKCSSHGNIAAHIKSHEIHIKQFGCNLCSFTYSSLSKLGAHFREYHGVGKKNL